MKKVAIALVALLILAAPAAFAQFRVDAGFNAPLRVGISGLPGVSSDPIEVPAFLPLPFVQLSYSPSIGPINLGVGLKAYTLIILNLAWPTVYAEIDLHPIVLQASVGGGFLFYFGAIGSGVLDTNMVMPELAAFLKLGKTGRLGLGAMTFIASENQEVFPYLIYGTLQFAFPF